ncbi:MAG: anhydro-N-acetylmuramic acid kinase, partial [Cyclobacteriaceae bacterium]
MKIDNQQPDMLKKDVYQVLGIMSGTSCDGVDIAHCNFILNNNNWQFEIKNADTFSYPEGLQHTLKNVTSLSAIDLALLDIELGFFFASQVNFFIDKNQILKTDLDFIASHGHTVFHQPQKKLTLQIGNGEALYQQTGIRVINNFREADVLAGGQGAPLVPIGDKLLFSDYDYCLNLGGISNISFDQQKKRVAFDIG